MSEPTESEKYVHLTRQYLVGNGVDIGCGSNPVVPWAIALDLPPKEYAWYHSNHEPGRCIQWGGDARSLPFKDGTCDFVYSSHLIEDFADWTPILREWTRVVKPGGYLVIMLPDRELWGEAIRKGQPPNCEHRHESFAGELTQHVRGLGGFEIIEDRLTNCHPGDYNILFVARKV